MISMSFFWPPRAAFASLLRRAQTFRPFGGWRRLALAGEAALAVAAIAAALAYGPRAHAQTSGATPPAGAASGGSASVGSASGLPVPRYVSLKTDRVNLREGPTKDHRTLWVFQRAGLPVEVTAEFEIWRRVRDSEGVEGWVLHSLLSGRRTALVAPWADSAPATTATTSTSKPGAKPPAPAPLPATPAFELRAKPDPAAPVLARLESGVVASVRSCDGRWCRVSAQNGAAHFSGFLLQEQLWGVYPGETVK